MMTILAILLLNIFSIAYIHSQIPPPVGQQQIIDQINSIRRNVSPQGSDIREVEWSQCLAQVAYDYLRECNPAGSVNENIQAEAIAAGCEMSNLPVGQTIFTTLESGSHDPITDWAAQGDDYDFDTDTCSSMCNNYKQLVNAATSVVGCSSFNEGNCGRTGVSAICYYANATTDGQPYTEGTPCALCTGEFPTCNDGLCIAEASTDTEPTPTGSTSTGSTNEVTDCPTNHHHHNHNHNHDHNHDHKNHDHGKGGGKGKGKGKGKGEGKGEGDDEGISGFLGVYAEDKSDATSNSIMILLLVATILSVLLSSL